MKYTIHQKIAATAIAILVSAAVSAQEVKPVGPFRFKYKKNDTYRILSRVNEDVYVNNTPNHHSEIVSRIAVRVTDVDDKGNGTLESSFMASDEAADSVSGKHFTWNEDYRSNYIQDTRGRITIDRQYFMPVVRNMPVFPETPLKPGDTWTEQGAEAHDLRRTFNLQTPFIVPFAANYTYTGVEKGSDNKLFYVLTATYTMYYETPAPEVSKNQPYADYPVSTLGYSSRTIYWDAQKGNIDHYNEKFSINIETSYGNTYKFTGTARAEITEFHRTGTDENVKQARAIVKKLNIPDVSVTAGDKGLTFNLENIQFEPDSAVLPDHEKSKLQEIAKILKEYPDNDLLISGHTALAGTKESRLELSEERAQAVADYIVGIGVKDAYHVFTRGFGAQVPIASNETEAGKAKNRRVEITILDN